MKFNIDLTGDCRDKLTERQVVLLTDDQNRRLIDFAKNNGVGVSELLRNVIVQILDSKKKR